MLVVVRDAPHRVPVVLASSREKAEPGDMAKIAATS